MEKVPTLREVSIQLQSTTADIRLKNAQLAGVIEYLDAGYEPHVHDFCPNRAKFLDHRLLSLKDDLRNLEFNIKEYVSKTLICKMLLGFYSFRAFIVPRLSKVNFMFNITQTLKT